MGHGPGVRLNQDRKDRNQARRIAIGIAVLGTIWLLAAITMIGGASEMLVSASTGLGWRDGASLAFLLSSTLMILFALVSDAGVLGELPTMAIGFVLLFLLAWPLLVFLF